MRFAKLATCLVLAIALLSVPGSAAATESQAGATTIHAKESGNLITDELPKVLVLDENRTPEILEELKTTIDSANRTISVTVKDGDSKELVVLVNSTWLESLLPDLALVETKYEMDTYQGATWYSVKIPEPGIGRTLVFEDFAPKIQRAAYSRGSLQSVRLERPMFVRVAEVPRLETEAVRMSNVNGTWVEEVPKPVNRLGIEFTDADTTGQTVALNRSWLGAYGLTEPYFQHEDGASISNTSDDYHYYLYPAHFSILYVFTTNEAFWKEDYGTYSDVVWDSVNRNIYIKADRRDPVGVDERIRSPAPVVYDQTSSFTVRATWKIANKGHWQYAVPVFFMGASNDRVDMANSVYVMFASRDQSSSHPYYNPAFFLRYRDSGGTMRWDSYAVVPYATQYEVLMSYDAYTRTMRWEVLDSFGTVLAWTTYVVGPSETFSFSKVGAGAWGGSNTLEPRLIASTDNIYLEANMARNGNFETDSNSDGIPDNWQLWIWSKACTGCISRSTTIKKFGSWSVKIQDSDSTKDYGLQTVRMSVLPGETYTGSVWVYESSGWNQLCLEFWDSVSGGTRKGVVCKSASTWLEWEFLDVTMRVPAGAYYADLLVYSSSSNTGTGYLDGAELRRSRSFWSIHVHTNHVPDAATWGRVLDYVTDLGITSVRIDFVWRSFMPNSNQIDESHAVYWDQAIRVARARGVEIVAILNGGQPDWAIWLRDGGGDPADADPDAYFAEWRRFARIIALRYGQDITYYQLLNEENHPAHSLYPHRHDDGEPRAFYEAYIGLIEGTGLTFATHKSRFKTIVNAFADDLLGGNNWNQWFRDILNDYWGDDSIDVVAIDHYPGTWCCGSNYRDWAALDTLLGIARDYGKELAIMETGFSTYDDNGHGQDDQEIFVDQSMDEILAKRNSYGSTYPLNSLLHVSWYEFIDLCTGCWALIRQEPNFGILTYDSGTGAWGLKLALDNLRYQVSRW